MRRRALSAVSLSIALAATALASALAAQTSDEPFKDIPWTEGSATVYLGDDETKLHAEQMARAKAQADALEKAVGIEIKSTTVVEFSAVSLDLTQAFTQGTLQRTEVLDKGWRVAKFDKEDVLEYHIRLRGKALKKDVRHDPSFRAELKLSKDSIRPGDELTISVVAQADCYVNLFAVDYQGTTSVILPNQFHTDNAVKRGTTLEFPSAVERRNDIVLRAALPEDVPQIVEKVVLIATRNPVDLVGKDFKEAIKVYAPGDTGSYERLVEKIHNLSGSDWTQEIAQYRISRR